jgi:amino acid adenylation domain-containing protein
MPPVGNIEGEARGASRAVFVAPRTALESAIANIWQDVLGLERVGVQDGFFELGGESLAAVHMLAAVEDVLLAQVSFADFLDRPTVVGLAGAVQLARGRHGPAGSVPEAGPVSGYAPCTFAQERLWFVEQLAGATGAYNEAVGVRLRGPLDERALERSVQEVVRRHAALRTGFEEQDGAPVQVVAADVTVALERIDLSRRTDPDAELRARTDALASTPFDLTRPPLMRASLLRLGDEDHVLQLVFHHIVSDGWSHVVFLRELGELYRAGAAGQEARLPVPPLQYPDFARWQRARLTGQALEDAIAPWRERLADIPAVLELPSDHPRPPVPSHRGATARVRLGLATTEAIQAFGRAEGATPFATLLAVFDVLLHRYSGQETIMVGTATAGRDRPELEHVLGLFANTIVLRSDVSGEPTFRELLARVRRVVLDAVAHQEAPFERLVAELHREPDLSRHPIFQVFFSLRPHAALDLPDSEPFYANPRTSRTDLTVWVEEGPDGFELVWESSSDLFEATTIDRLQRHFVCLLRAALVQPDTRIGHLPLLEDSERRELLEQSRPLRADAPVACIHECFEAQAALRPDAPAATFDAHTVTYGELNVRANRLAHRLRELGIGPESLVALFLERSLELVVAVLAVLKAGGAYVPLDPEYPAARLAFVLSDTEAPVLLTQTDLLDRLPTCDAQFLCLDREDAELAHYSSANPEANTTPENLAYVIYTSGSTGQPKGVQVEHRQIARLFTATEHWFHFGPTDTWVLTHSYAFDVSVWELWGALAHGGRIVVPRFWVTRSPDAFAELMAEQCVTVLSATPSLFTSVQEELIARGEALALRFVVFAGEALQPASLRPWFDRFGADGATLVNMYGITETTVHSSYRVMRAADCNRDASPIGVPITDLSLYLLDAAGEPVPPGVAGEIYVGGGGVTRGYLKRPELTTQRFLQNPFGPGRLYRSGDLARQLPDGEIGFLGRMDDQVKLRGFRIELGEIRAALEEQEAVADCAVLPVKVGDDDLRLAAYVVPAEDVSTGSAEAHGALRDRLISHLKDKLPEYMVPSSITFLDKLPLTTNGKLDRRKLPTPEWERPPDLTFIPPRTATERMIAEIWGDVLGAEQIGAQDNFFDLGGHSLLAARVIARVRQSANAEVSVRTLFEHPTVAAFAEHVAVSVREHAPVNGAVDDRIGGSSALEYPLSFQQQQLLFFDQLSPDSVVYNSALAIRIEGKLDRDVLRGALTAVFRRQEALRTVLVWDDVSARQIVLEDWELPFEDVSATQIGQDGSELRRAIVDRARRPFELAREGPLRTTLFCLDEATHVILFQPHHVAFDARAVEVLYAEVGETYAAALQQRPAELPELPKQYRDFALLQRKRLQGEKLDRELDFWRAKLAGAPTVLDLRTDYARPAMQSFDGAVLVHQLSGELADRVRETCRLENVTPYMLLLAAFATLLYRRTGQDDILFGGPMANRDQPEFQDLIGFFANTIVVRVRLGGNPTFSELLASVRDSVLESYEHQEVPFELVVDAVRPARDPGLNPLFQVNFRVRVGEPPVLNLAGTRTSAVPVDLGLARFDLALELHLLEGGVAAEFNWNTALFAHETIQRLAADFEGLLAHGLTDPETKLLSLELGARSGNESHADPSGPAPGAIRGFRGAIQGSK